MKKVHEGQASLADLLGANLSGESSNEVEKPEEAGACASGEEKQSADVAPPAKEEAISKEVKFDDAWVVLYAGRACCVKDLSLSKYTEAELKKALIKDYPEFGVTKVVFNYNQQKKAIVPVVRGDTKGGC